MLNASDNLENSQRRIPARSRRQVMDWSLVLASQSLNATISQDEQGWGLLVADVDYARASETIALYQNENRAWRWRQPLSVSGRLFHWGAAIWGVLILWIHFWASPRFAQLENIAWMNNRAVAAGEWWRIFTAITLHADGAHLASNATIGFLLIGLAMARQGAGVGLGAAYLAGAGGNLLGFFLHDPTHRGLGASGMVMGALGLAAAQRLEAKSPWAVALVFRALTTGVFLFILMGTSPGTDVIAHLGGFVFGAIFGILLSFRKKENSFHRTLLDRVCLFALPAWVIFTWWLALTAGFQNPP